MGEGEIYIVTGPVGSGKTTSLQAWIKEKKNVKGILTPVIENKRQFYDIHSAYYFEMLDESDDALIIGKYRFSKTGFERAGKIIREGIPASDWLVIDEIGPLELRGEGFNTVLKNILNISERKFNLILVIREGLVSEALKYFNIDKYEILNLTMDKFMQAAIDEAKLGLSEGGIPIGSVIVRDGQIIGRGHNKRVQDGDPITHAEIDCLRNAGRIGDYKNTVLYSTLMPCYLCAGAVVQFGIMKVYAGENETFDGAKEFMESKGVEVINLESEECKVMMRKFIAENPKLWFEDIGEL